MKKNNRSNWFHVFAGKISQASGTSVAFIIAVFVVIIWLISGPFFHFSDTWQLVINTGTTIITFLMVFLIQHSQNRDTLALQLKLDELISANEAASNRLLSVDDLTSEELDVLKRLYARRASQTQIVKEVKEEKEDKLDKVG